MNFNLNITIEGWHIVICTIVICLTVAFTFNLIMEYYDIDTDDDE